jgi:hypothetical protein
VHLVPARADHVIDAPQEVRTVVARESERIPDDVEGELRAAVELGHRVGRYLAAVAADQPERASQLWHELHAALEVFAGTRGNPWGWKELRGLSSRKITGAQLLLNAFDKAGGTSCLRLAVAPNVAPRYQGRPDDIVAQAEALFRQARGIDRVRTAHIPRGVRQRRRRRDAAHPSSKICLPPTGT